MSSNIGQGFPAVLKVLIGITLVLTICILIFVMRIVFVATAKAHTIIEPGQEFWCKPMVRDLVITDSKSGQTITVRQIQLVTFQALYGDEIKPESDNGKPTVWIYRDGKRFKEAPMVCPGPDGRMTQVDSYQLIDKLTRLPLTFFCANTGTLIPTNPALRGSGA